MAGARVTVTLVALFLAVNVHLSSPTLAEGSFPDPATAAAAMYGPGMSLRPAPSGAFSDAFPLATMYQVIEGDGHAGQTHNMAWWAGRAFDMTRDFHALAYETGHLAAAPQAALAQAKAFAETGNAELQLVRVVVGSADANDLGAAIADPVVVTEGPSQRVTLTTWTHESGALQDWSILFTNGAPVTAEWRVRAIGLGPFLFRFEAAALPPGMRVVNDYASGAHAVRMYVAGPQGDEQVPAPTSLGGPATSLEERRFPNFDGSVWVVTFPVLSGTSLDVEALATMAGAEAVEVYSRMVSQNLLGPGCSGTPSPRQGLGFEIAFETCEYPLNIGVSGCGACPNSPGVEVGIHVRAVATALGFYQQATPAEFYRTVIAHEYMHVLHRMGAGDGGVTILSEGLAATGAMLAVPEVEQQPTAYWYGVPGSTTVPAGIGANYFLERPDIDICLSSPYFDRPSVRSTRGVHGHDYSLFWATVYESEGGSSAFRDLVAALRVPTYMDADKFDKERCPTTVPAAVSEVLAARPGGTSDFASALRSLTVRMYEHDFVWAPAISTTPEDWSVHMVPPTRIPVPIGTTTPFVAKWGLKFHLLPAAGTYDVSAAPRTFETFDAWRHTLLLKAENGTVTEKDLSNGQVHRVTGSAYAEVVVASVRANPGDGEFSLHVTLPPPCVGCHLV